MFITLDALMKDNSVVNAIIDRAMQTQYDTPIWTKYLKARQVYTDVIKNYLGSVSNVQVGSMIEPHGKKPLRSRPNMGTSTVELGYFGDEMQMDRDQLDRVQKLIDKFNGQNDKAVINEIVNFLADDYRQMIVAPNKAIDKLVSEARSQGVFKVRVEDGAERSVALPCIQETATTAEKAAIIGYLRNLLSSHEDLGNTYSVMQMTANTFYNTFIQSAEFLNTFKLKFGAADVNLANITTVEQANMLLVGNGLLPIEIVKENYLLADGSNYKGFADGKISLIPSYNLGTLDYYKTREWTREVTGVNKTEAGEANHILVSTESNKEGETIAYDMCAVPNFSAPQKIAIIDVSAT